MSNIPTESKRSTENTSNRRTGNSDGEDPIAPTGLLIELIRDGTVVLSQEPYIRELPKMDAESRIDNEKVRNPSGLRSTFRQAIGALIWVRQTRPDIGYTITSMPTSSVEACKSPGTARGICRK